MSERESHGKRTRIRVEFLVWMRTANRMANVRLKRKHVTMSVANADQAELVIETLRAVCKSLDGKWLAK